MLNCQRCSHANAPDAAFCEACGAHIAKRCRHCGREISNQAQFCIGCGRQLRGSAPGLFSPDVHRDSTPPHLLNEILKRRSQLEGQRKQVTILFVDIRHSLELARQLDPEEWHRILDRFFEILSEGVHRFEGTINQFTGDGIMAIFGAPLALEDHASRACYAALHLRDTLQEYSRMLRREQELDFSARMGLDSGEIVVGKIGDDLRMDYTGQGYHVGMAARMQQLAEGGQIYLTDDVASQIRGYFALEDLGEFKIKGADAPVRVHSLAGVGPLKTRLDLSRERGLSRFVGRKHELELLDAAYEQATSGRNRAIGVVGLAGIGKSRLCYEFVEQRRMQGTLVLETHCSPFGRTIPFHAVLGLLRCAFRIHPGDSDQETRDKIAGRSLLLDESLREFLPTVFDFLGVPDPLRPVPTDAPDTRQNQLFEFLSRLVRARSAREPAILLLDDLQWIDPGSDFFLDHLFEAVKDTRTLLLLNFRPGYQASWMQKTWYRELRLGPLDRNSMSALVHDLLGDDPSLETVVESVLARSEGIPFFAEEIVRSLLLSGHLEGTLGAARLAQPFREAPCCLTIPQSLESIVTARIDELPEREKKLLQEASVIGKSFSRPVLEAVSGISNDEITESLHRLRQLDLVTEESLYPVATYAFSHPLLQEVVYASQLKETRARLHARVARAMADRDPALPAEDAALVAFHWEEGGDKAEAGRWHARAAEWAGTTRAAEALRHWRRAYELLEGVAEAEGVSDAAVDACYGILNLGWRVGLSREEATRVVAAGSALAERRGDVGKLALLKSAYGSICGVEGDANAFVAACREAARLADRSGDADVEIAVTWRLVYGLLLTGKLREALATTERAFEAAGGDLNLGASLVLTSPLAGLSMFRTMLLCFMGRLGEVEEAKDQMLHLAREANRYEALCLALSTLPYLAWARGDTEHGLGQARQALALSEKLESPFFRHAALQSVGLARLLEGQLPEAISTLQRARSVVAESGTGLDVEGWALSTLAEAELATGDVKQAIETAEQAVASVRSRGTHLYAIHAELTFARALLYSGEKSSEATVEEILGRIEERIQQTGARLYLPFLRVQRAALAQMRGDKAAGRRELEEARRAFIAIGAPARAASIANKLTG